MDEAPRRLVILGSTGSIGVQTLDVVERLAQAGEVFDVVGLAAGRRLDRLGEQIAVWRPQAVSVAEESGAASLREKFPEVEVLAGDDGLCALCRLEDVSVVVNALVGAVGLIPTLEALTLGRAVALANKESLVIGGELVVAAMERGGGRLIPIDSEHNALAQCLRAGSQGEVRHLILTASGGPFLRTTPSVLDTVTPRDALAHPTWAMGARITVDSATMVNKAFEVIEAHFLFGIPYDRIDVLVHPGSTVHSLVEYRDGSFVAELASPDMRIPIQYALIEPRRVDTGLTRLDLGTLSELRFEPLDPQRFPAFGTVLTAADRGGSAPAAVNAADEVLVSRFLAEEIPFTGISEGLARMLELWDAERDEVTPETPPTLASLLCVDAWARDTAQRMAF